MANSAPLPFGSRRQRKRKQLADRVAGVAFDLFEAHGYEAVTMEQIAAAGDVAKGTLYKYFAVKEALLAHQFQRDIASGMSLLWQVLEQQSSFAAQLKAMLHASARWNEARRRYIPYYVRYQFSSGDFGAEGQIFERLCVVGQQRGDVRTDVSAARMAGMLECMYLGAIVSWLGNRGRSLKAEFDALMMMALNGMRPG